MLSADKALTFINEYGGRTAPFIKDEDYATRTITTEWDNPNTGGKVTGVISLDGTIVFNNGSVWKKLNLVSDYMNDGKATRIENDVTGNSKDTFKVALKITNEQGGSSTGKWINPTHRDVPNQIEATDWNLIGTVANGTIQWTNKSNNQSAGAWKKNATVTGFYDDGSSPTSSSLSLVTIRVTDKTLTFENRNFGTVAVQLVSRLGPTTTSRLSETSSGVEYIRPQSYHNPDAISKEGRNVYVEKNRFEFTKFGTARIFRDFDPISLDAAFADIKIFPFG